MKGSERNEVKAAMTARRVRATQPLAVWARVRVTSGQQQMDGPVRYNQTTMHLTIKTEKTCFNFYFLHTYIRSMFNPSLNLLSEKIPVSGGFPLASDQKVDGYVAHSYEVRRRGVLVILVRIHS